MRSICGCCATGAIDARSEVEQESAYDEVEARGAGDLATASRCQAILDRYAAVLADRDKRIAFLLMGELEL
jgi:hypothetical protein